MHYYLYEIKNLVNGKVYVGVHKATDIDDGYMGSGKIIKAAIAKYGLENFTKTILEKFEDAEQMFAREAEVVNEQFLAREDVYNLRRGGTGGFDYINASGLNTSWKNPELRIQRHIDALKLRLINDPALRQSYIDNLTRGRIKSIEVRQIKYPDGVWKGKQHSDVTKQRMSECKLGKGTGVTNSQFGKMWITNEVENKKILKDDVIPIGWRKGRVCSVT